MSAKTFLIQSETLGRGQDDLGKVVMSNFLRLLGESENKAVHHLPLEHWRQADRPRFPRPLLSQEIG